MIIENTLQMVAQSQAKLKLAVELQFAVHVSFPHVVQRLACVQVQRLAIYQRIEKEKLRQASYKTILLRQL